MLPHSLDSTEHAHLCMCRVTHAHNRQAFNATKSSLEPDIQFNKHQFKVLLTRSRKREEKEDMTWGEIGSFCSLSLQIIEDLPNMHLGESVSVHPSLSVLCSSASLRHKHMHTHMHVLFLFLSFSLNQKHTHCTQSQLYFFFLLNFLYYFSLLFFCFFCLIFRFSEWACPSACVCLYICVHV